MYFRYSLHFDVVQLIVTHNCNCFNNRNLSETSTVLMMDTSGIVKNEVSDSKEWVYEEGFLQLN